MERWKKVLLVGIQIVLIFTIIVCSKKAKESKDNVEIVLFEDSTIVAMVNGESISNQDVDDAAKLMILQTGQGNKVSYQDSAIQHQALDHLIANTLLKQEVLKHIIEIKTEDVDNAIKVIERRLPAGETLDKALQKENITMRKFKDNVVLELKVQKLVQNEVFSQVSEIDSIEAKEYYTNNPGKFLKPTQAHARHILIRVDESAEEAETVKARTKAQSILTKIEQGEDFIELAKTYSEGPTAPKGGDLGYFSRDDMVKSFDEKVFSMKPGEVSDLVRTKFGFHIIKLEEFKESEQISFEKVENDIKRYLKQVKSNELFEKYIEKLKQKSKIQLRKNV